MTWTSDYGTQRACPKRHACSRTERARTHL